MDEKIKKLIEAAEEAYHELRIRCGYKPGDHAYDVLAEALEGILGPQPWLHTIQRRKKIPWNYEDLAHYFGFPDAEAMFQNSEIIIKEGPDIKWWITQVCNGVWIAWDDAEIAPDRIRYFDSREEAIKFQKECWEETRKEEDEG